MNILEDQPCPFCKVNKLALIEDEKDIPHFGKVFLFSMNCKNCDYKISDIECAEIHEPSKYTITIDNEKDMSIKIVKSSTATVKIPQLKISVEPGNEAEGYITNVEGLLDRFVKVLEAERDTAEDNDIKKHAKNLLKKIWKVKLGDFPLKIIIEDKNGNSAIISDKAIKEKIR